MAQPEKTPAPKVDLAKAQQATDDQVKLDSVSPTVFDMVDVLGPESYEEHGDEWRVQIVDPSKSPEENKQRLEAVGELMAKRREVQTEITHRNSAGIDMIDVWDEKNRIMREVPAYMEDQIIARQKRDPSYKRDLKPRVTGRRKRITSESEIRGRMARERDARSNEA